MWKKISQRCWVSFRKRFFISFVYWINSNTVSKPYRIIRRSLRTGRFTLLECKAVSDSSVVSSSHWFLGLCRYRRYTRTVQSQGVTGFTPTLQTNLSFVRAPRYFLWRNHDITISLFYFWHSVRDFFMVFCNNVKFENYS